VVWGYLGVQNVRDLDARALNPAARKKLANFLRNLRVYSTVPHQTRDPPKYKKIMGVTTTGADDYTFENGKTGETLTITVRFVLAHTSVLG